MIWQKLNLLQPKTKFKPQIILTIISLILAMGISISISNKIPAQARTEKNYEEKLFETALSFTLYFEGGFSNHPADKGGRTYKGILQSVYNAYRRRRGLPPLDVTQMSDAELMEIYQGYWDNSRSATMHPALAVVMFDTAVNFGINNSVTFLQQALGLPQTGIFDTKTKEALAEGNNRNTALQMINERIIYRYKRVQEDASQMAFFHGWLARDYSLWGYVEKLKDK
ncbi:glycoside hydrolase family 108 protein [Dapis sp. BLCC M126]|uniref:glycoside hydrolase family 108 protein n=1 Tax=Dapis sp. BLCC M126 TaxID=3400189 RepID=UPI003CF01F59